MIGKATGPPVSITGLGAYVPERVLTNDELSTIVDTSDEWIMDRTGIRERRIAAPEQVLADMLGAQDAAAYDLLAGCTGFMYALVQAYGMIAASLADRALVIGGDVLSRILDWTDRSTL